MSSPEMVIVPSGFLQRWLPSGARSGVVLNASPSSSWSIACQPLEEPCFEHSPMPSSMGLSSTEGQVLEQPLQRRLEQLRQLQRYMQDELENRQKDQHRIMGINYHDTDFPESIPMPVTVLDPQFPQRLESLLQDQEEQRMLEAGERNSYPGSVLEVEEPSPPSEDMLTKTEDRPIKPGLGTNTKTFEELLEEQLKLEEQRLVGKTQKEAPKRPFLRRGEGHTRYKLHPRGTKTSTDKMHLKLASLTGITGQIASDPSANLHRGAVAEGFIPGGQATQVQHKKESHSQPSPNIQGAQQAGQQMLVQGSPRCAAETSFEVWQREKQQECAELNEFELLEVAAEELSFSSNSSFMQALTCRGGWQRRLSSTPMKAQKLNQHIPSHGGSADESLDTSFCSDPAVPLPVVTPPYDKCVYQKAEHNANDISSDANVTLVDNVFDDDDTWTDLLDHSQSAMQPEKTLKRKVAVAKGMGSANPKDSEALPTSQLVAKLFPVLRPKPSPPPVVSPKPQPSSAEHRAAQSQLLRERLVELETEIERFKTENAAFSSLKQEQIQLNKQLRRERDIFEKERREAESAWEEFKREESRKLQREKKLFEKHAAAARAAPSVRDREEMQMLKQQVAEAQAELHRREQRWTRTHSRLRQQLQTMNSQNLELREQIRTLEKLRLSAWKAQKDQNKTASNNKSGTLSVNQAEKQINSPEGQVQRRSLPPAVSGLGSDTSPDTADALKIDAGVASAAELCKEITHADGKVERVLSDGVRLILFPNGTRKEVLANGTMIITFFNGDVKEISNQQVVYYYASAQTTHTTFPDGTELLQFPNSQTEKLYPDGRKEILFPDHTLKTLHPNGTEESVLQDGTIIRHNPDGSKELMFVNGERELHTSQSRKRIYIDGTIKTVFSDGRQETRYSSGRLRIKDPDGNIVMDTCT